MATKKKPTSTKGKAKKKSEETEDDVTIRSYNRDLTVGLTREEVEDRALRMSRVLCDYDIAVENEKQRAKASKAHIADINTEIRRLGNAVRDKVETKSVACERRLNYTKGKVFDFRLDTGELIEERDMTDPEKQKGLPFEGPGDVDDEFDDAEDAEDDETEESDDSEDEAAE